MKWVSKVPGHEHETGELNLFDDDRIRWMMEHIDVCGKSIVDYGSLEGGHACMLLNRGADYVICIEANPENYDKLVTVRKWLELPMMIPVLGDARKMAIPCDVTVACGILYHLTNPPATLHSWCAATRAMYIWTHCSEGKSVIHTYGEKTNLDGVEEYCIRPNRELIENIVRVHFRTVVVREQSSPHPNGPVLELIAKDRY